MFGWVCWSKSSVKIQDSPLHKCAICNSEKNLVTLVCYHNYCVTCYKKNKYCTECDKNDRVCCCFC